MLAQGSSLCMSWFVVPSSSKPEAFALSPVFARLVLCLRSNALIFAIDIKFSLTLTYFLLFIKKTLGGLGLG